VGAFLLELQLCIRKNHNKNERLLLADAHFSRLDDQNLQAPFRLSLIERLTRAVISRTIGNRNIAVKYVQGKKIWPVEYP
jgi:hypothetical protein